MARRGGTAVVVGMPRMDATLTVPGMRSSSRSEKRLLRLLYGSAQVQPRLPALRRLVETGRLDLGRWSSRRITLDEVNDAFEPMEAGEVIRSVMVMA